MKATACTDCPTAKAASLLSDMWTMLIVRDLLKSPLRFNELLESLEGVSTRTLTLKLKHLEEGGIVRKEDVRYALTPSGTKLGPVIAEMEKYGKKYL
ncbi:MAG: helix-turn-helix domain-containing protein [Patescibacteria group bacterium]